ncbi:MAG: DapH/DapD/GlmU-related protein [Planctomycetota bacterium]
MIGRVLRGLRKSYWNSRARIQFGLRGVRWPADLTVLGPLGLSAAGSIELGESITIVNRSEFNRAGIDHPTQLVAAAGATLRVGDRVGMSGATVYATEQIDIGSNVLIGANSQIFDTDFHPIDWRDRREGKSALSAPVVIEDDVWLGANVTVLKGVRIGARSVIAAGSIVHSDVPSDVLAGGVPAKVIRALTN